MKNQASLEEWESRLLVGRDGEIRHFLHVMESRTKKIINVFGTAGVGKSYLLDEWMRLARTSKIAVITLDGDGFWHSPAAFCLHILHALQLYEYDSDQQSAFLIEACIQKLNEKASAERVAVFLDNYEKMESLDHWLREYFFKQLHDHILIVIAGRHPLSEAWLLSPGWRQFISRIPLSHLNYEAVERYAQYCHIFENEQVKEIWHRSKGHPLMLSLLAFTLQQTNEPDGGISSEEIDTLPFIVSQWLREVPGEHLRPLVEAASVLRYFNQENLSFLLDREITSSEFYQLIRFSFVRKVENGWTIHALMREAVIQELRLRTPQRFSLNQSRAIHYYYEKFRMALDSSRADEALELTYYIGDTFIRAFMSWIDPSARPFEPVDRSFHEELADYVQKRHEHASPKTIKLFDADSNRHFHFELTAEQTLYSLKWLDLDQLFALGYDVIRVLRNERGSIEAMVVIVPINLKTLPYLMKHPGSSSYFTALSAEQLERFAVPEHTRAGWFIDMIDQDDYEDVAQHTAIGHLLNSLMFTGEFLLRSPAPLPFFKAAHESMGYEIAEFATHCHYDGVTPTPVFVRDTQGEQFSAYLQKLILRTGIGTTIPDDEAPPPAEQQTIATDRSSILEQFDLTAREKEVASLVSEGLTNAEIASRLYVSEVTVKKHLKSIFEKLDVSNRTQLVKKMLV